MLLDPFYRLSYVVRVFPPERHLLGFEFLSEFSQRGARLGLAQPRASQPFAVLQVRIQVLGTGKVGALKLTLEIEGIRAGS